MMADTNSSHVLTADIGKQSSSLKEFTNYCYCLLMNLSYGRYERQVKEDTDNTCKRGHIVEIEHENEIRDYSGDNDDDDNPGNELMKVFFRDGSLSIPFELFKKILKFPTILLRGPAKVIYKPSKTYETIKANLTHYQDNGDFGEFDTYAEEMVIKHKDCYDIVAAVKIEQARCALYKGKLMDARRFACQANEVASRTQFPTFFDAQVSLIMSSILRNTKNKLGEANTCLDDAEQCFESVYSIEVLALYHELRGSYFDKFLGMFAKPDDRVKKLALTSFQKMSEIGSQHSMQRVSDKKRFYAMVKSARILLDSNSPVGRCERSVTKDSVHQAAECVRIIKRYLLSNIPRGSKIQFQLVESDLCYRRGDFEDAMQLLNKTLNEAEKLGYKTECPKIKQRIQEIQRLTNSKMKFDEVLVEEKCENTSCKDSEISSQSGSDVFDTEYF